MTEGKSCPPDDVSRSRRSLVMYYSHVGGSGEGFEVRPVARLSISADAASVDVTVLDPRHVRALRVLIEGPRASTRHRGSVTIEDGDDYLDAVLRDTATSSTWGVVEEDPPVGAGADAPPPSASDHDT